MADDVTVTPCVNGDLRIEGPGFLAWVEPSGCIVVCPDLDTSGDVIALADVPASVMAAILNHHPTVLDLRRQLEQARRIAVHLEHLLAEVGHYLGQLQIVPGGLAWRDPETRVLHRVDTDPAEPQTGVIAAAIVVGAAQEVISRG